MLALKEEACGLQREELVRDAEIGRMEPHNRRDGRLNLPMADDRENVGNKIGLEFAAVRLRGSSNLLIAGNRHMHMAIALILRVDCGRKWPMTTMRFILVKLGGMAG